MCIYIYIYMRLSEVPPVLIRSPGQEKFSAVQLLNYMRTSRLLRAGSQLSTAVQLGIEAHWPGLFEQEVLAKSSKDPGATTLFEWSFMVDMALLLYQQQQNENPNMKFFRFGWTDATDLRGRQLLISKHIRIECGRIVRSLQVVHQLCADRRHAERALRHQARLTARREADPEASSSSCDSGPSSDELQEPQRPQRQPPPAPLTRVQRQALCKELRANLVQHTSIPTGLALGHTDLAAKMAATTHAFVMETATLGGLRRVARSFMAYTTDMGTELGAAEFRGSVDSMVPHWHPERAERARLRFETDEGAQGGGDDDDEDECYFPFAVGIPGMNHVVHNLSADIDHRLTWWPRFWEGLRTVAALLTNDQRRKRVWKNCVKDSTYADMERNFMKGVPKLYMKRWGMIIAFINHVRPLLLVLRRTWSQAAYQGRGPEDAARESETAALAGGGEEAEISNVIIIIITTAVSMIILFVLM